MTRAWGCGCGGPFLVLSRDASGVPTPHVRCVLPPMPLRLPFRRDAHHMPNRRPHRQPQQHVVLWDPFPVPEQLRACSRHANGFLLPLQQPQPH